MDTLPIRTERGHKGTFGTVMIVGGSETMLGAPCFAASSALRCGAGIVRMALPDQLMLPALTLVPSAMASLIGTDIQRWLTTLAPETVLAVGCGWGHSDDRRTMLRMLLETPHRLVIDADGLHALASLPSTVLPRSAPTVLTPHPGEYNLLATTWDTPMLSHNANDRVEAATALAARTNAVIVLKGADTVVADTEHMMIDRNANAALAIPGSGDVLTGLIAGLMAQGLEALAASRLAVRLHSIAGELWRKQMGSVGLLAMELANLIPEAMRLYRTQSEQTTR